MLQTTEHTPADRKYGGNRARAFTLIELLICVVILLILMIGLNSVFQAASHSVAAGETLSDQSRSIRAAQGTLAQDFASAAGDSPAFIINSSRVSWFANADDYNRNASNTANPLQYDPNNTGNPANYQLIAPAATNFRSHRVDTLSFFLRGGPFYRQTGDGTNFVQPISGITESSNEAWVMYGHLRLPGRNNGPQVTATPTYLWLDNGGTGRMDFFRGPEEAASFGVSSTYMNAATNANTNVGAFAADWILGRNLMLLKDTSNVASSGTYVTNTAPVRPTYLYYGGTYSSGNNFFTRPAWQVNLAPLSYDSSYTGYTLPVDQTYDRIEHSRYDLAGTTIDQFRRLIDTAVETENSLQPNPSYINNASPPLPASPLTYVRWWHPLVFAQHPCLYNNSGKVSANDWQVGSVFTTSPALMTYRFNCNPLVSNPMDALMSAQASPEFLSHVTQFIVEYAGDYLSQDASGNVNGLSPDGQIDYYVDGNGVRKIRWYGLPRCTDGSGHIYGYAPGVTASQMPCVVPLRDIRKSYSAPDIGAPFEQDMQYYCPTCYDINNNKNGDYGLLPTGAGATNYGLAENARYVCAWRNDTPAMIRLTLKFDDSYDRVTNGQTVEMVFRLK